jgi:putative cell wall-binding protein
MIYMLGGEAVVPEAAITGLSGFKSKRLWGTDRYATNVEILKEAGVSGDEILVASGTGFADSLSASATGKPILLVKNAIQPSQKAFIESLMGKKFYMIGGTGAVSKDIETYFKGLGTVTRIDGATRYDTSANVAKTFFSEPKGAVIAYGANFPDGLCGGVLANTIGGPLVLTGNGNTDEAVKYAGETGMKSGMVLGGPTLISDDSAKAIFHLGADAEIIVR